MTDNDVLQLAQESARVYCRRYSSYENYDDAVGDACVYLLEHREKWDQEPRKLKRRVVGELVRGYQRAHGLRLKRPPIRVALDFETPTKNEGRTTEKSISDVVERALQQPDVASIAPVVLFILNSNSKEAANRFGLSKSAISKIKRRFSIVCMRLKNQEEGDSVPADARLSMPLFFQNERDNE